MWYTIIITLVVDFGGLLLVYLLLRDRVRRATSAESRISEISEEVSRLLVELNRATDRNIALMEDKITVLNEAISTADKKIGLLRRETEKHDVGSQIYSRLAEGRALRAPLAAPVAAETARAESPPRDKPPAEQPAIPLAVELSERNEVGVAKQLGAESAGYRGAESAGYRGAAEDVRQRVTMLFRAGFSPPLIASRVGIPLGEVELMIALEQRKGQA